MKSVMALIAFVSVNIMLVQCYTSCGPEGCYSTDNNGQSFGCGPNGCGINGQQPKINVQRPSSCKKFFFDKLTI